ncbi:unnamed protein product [Moneuplotes crassus]|uniref:MORN repeat protein n=1 Tax=Euplotes crassus TaxID=5936 RepID=A0AAD1XJH4_EUPCR|nr:unnamed protein product [Moneuplotes crassus]
MGECCSTHVEEEVTVKKRIITVSTTNRVGGAQDGKKPQKFEWSLDQRLKDEIRDLYEDHRHKIDEELDSRDHVHKKNFEMRNVSVVPEGFYEGSWNTKLNQRVGEGRIVFHNGVFYHGQFERNVPHGVGLKIFPSGDIYFGDFINGKIEGFGEYITSEGTRYEGDFTNNLKDGNGTQEWENGAYYEGGWKQGKKHGKGKLEFPDGSTYEGGFVNDRYHSKGIFRWADGKKYAGQYHKGKRHGDGKFVWPNGKIYQGTWNKGKQNGGGICSRGGTKRMTEYEKGRLTKVYRDDCL